ncbi:hypothetical protein UFOVP764_17 [uncultured Caudovirales phage]|uniref:Uncharacterized protein n=1 Tax=uncultured Caudovirales phage TaxID=2100421 RepID=A0A6J5NPE0_9CAUD|nr:hypothetical protein UFOVP764_17 [uncultured Caudovirales phage]
MALVDPNIAMSYRGIEVPNQLAQYGQIAQIQNAQNQNRLADLQYRAAEIALNKQRALQDYRSQNDPSSAGYYPGLRQIDPVLALEEEGKQAEIAKTRAEIDAKKFETENKRLDFTLQAIGSSPTPERAIAYINKGLRDGVFSMQEASGELAKLQNITPEDFDKYRMGQLQRTLAAKDQLEVMAPQIDLQDVGGQLIGLQGNRYQPGYRQPVPGFAPITKTATIGERTAQGNLALSQSQEAWKRANPGYDIQATEAGLVGINKNNPRDVVPISLDGQAVGLKPPPAKLVETDTQLSNLAGSLAAFKDEVAKQKLTGAKGLFTGEDTANMTSKYTALLMGVKDLYTLGALTGPDMGIIENQLQNPATWAASMTSKKAFDAQIKTIENMLRRNYINAETAFGRPLKATSKALAKFGATNTVTDPTGMVHTFPTAEAAAAYKKAAGIQ